MTAIGWIGLGLMGSKMLPHLIDAGHSAVVYARRPEQAQHFLELGSSFAATPAELASRADVTFTMVSGPDDVADVYLGPTGLLVGAASGSTLIDMTTSSPALARQISERARSTGVQCLDAPVSGGPAGAQGATLSIMVGGDTHAAERAVPLLSLLGKTIVYHGDAGAGQSAKITNQIALAGSMLGICEAFAFAAAEGLRPDAVLQTLSAGIAGSDLMRFLWPRIAARDLEPGFRIEHLIKDLGLALDAARGDGLALRGAELVNELCLEVVTRGYAGKGSQALITAIDEAWNHQR